MWCRPVLSKLVPPVTFSPGAHFLYHGDLEGFLYRWEPCAVQGLSLSQRWEKQRGERRTDPTPWLAAGTGLSRLLSTVRKNKDHRRVFALKTLPFWLRTLSEHTRNREWWNGKLWGTDCKINKFSTRKDEWTPERGSWQQRQASARKSSHASRRLCHQPSFSKSYFEISCFLLLEILKVAPGLSLWGTMMWTLRESLKKKKNCKAYHIFELKGTFRVIKLNSPPNVGVPSIASLTDGCLDPPWLLPVTENSLLQDNLFHCLMALINVKLSYVEPVSVSLWLAAVSGLSSPRSLLYSYKNSYGIFLIRRPEWYRKATDNSRIGLSVLVIPCLIQ